MAAPAAEPPRDCPLCPRLWAFRQTKSGARAGMVQCAGALLRAGRRPAADRRPRARAQGSQSHRPALHRRLCRRSPLRDARRVRLLTRPIRCASRRRHDARRCPHRQCGALCSAGKQAAARGDQDMRPFSCRDHRRNAASCARSSPSAASRMTRPWAPSAHDAPPRPSGMARSMRQGSLSFSIATTARATTRIPAC